MVAMTVVLTAVLYIMVLGLAGSPSETALYGGFATTTQTSNNTFTSTFAKFSKSIRPTQLTLIVGFGDDSGTYGFSSNEDAQLGFVGGVDVCDIYYDDVSDDALVSSGDILRFSGLSPGGTYTIILLDSSGNVLDQDEITLSGG